MGGQTFHGRTLCHAELDAIAEAPSPDAGFDEEGAVAGEGSPDDPSENGASVSAALCSRCKFMGH